MRYKLSSYHNRQKSYMHFESANINNIIIHSTMSLEVKFKVVVVASACGNEICKGLIINEIYVRCTRYTRIF